jgi:hypothetical protein
MTMSLTILLFACAPVRGAIIYVDARPDTLGGVWQASVGDALDAYVYINAETGNSILSHGAELDVQITGAGAVLPSIASITFLGSPYAYNSLGSGSEGTLVQYNDQEAYQSIYSSSSTALINDTRTILAKVHIITAGATPGDYILNPNGDTIGADVLQGSPVFTSGSIQLSAAVPEPGTFLLFASLMALLPAVVWRRKRLAA